MVCVVYFKATKLQLAKIHRSLRNSLRECAYEWGVMEKLILIVDDSNTNLFIAKNMLCDDYQVITLSSAEKMFAFLKKIKPDLILLDIEMPGMDGFEALELLKADKPDIPVIFLTVMNDSKMEARGLQLGAVDFLYKPLSKSTLLERIKPHITNKV